MREEAADSGQAALELAERLQVPGLLAQAFGAVDTADFTIGRGVDHEKLERTLELEDPTVWTSVALHPAVSAAMVFGFAGQPDTAVSLLERLREQYVER